MTHSITLFRSRFVVRAAFMLVGIGLLQTVYAQAPSYIVTDLSPLSGDYAFATRLNDKGQVVGQSSVNNTSPYRGVLWSQGTKTALGTLPAPFNNDTVANAINNTGQIVGFAFDSASIGPNDSHGSRAILWNGSPKDLGTIIGYRYAQANDINATGQIVGISGNLDAAGNPSTAGTLWKNGAIINLGTLPGDQHSSAAAINTAGKIVGVSGVSVSPSDQRAHAVLWSGSTKTNLGSLPGYTYGAALAINDLDQIVGYSYNVLSVPGSDNDYIPHATLWRSGLKYDLGALPGNARSQANAINASGIIVGTSYNKDTEHHAFVRVNGIMYDLNKVAAVPSGWVFNEATAVNAAGQIVCDGSKGGSGVQHGFLLTPVVATLTGFTLTPTSVPGGLSTTARVTLSAKAPGTGLKVPISYGSNVLATVSIAAGATSGSAPIKSGAPGVYKLAAKLGSVTLLSTFTVTAPILSGFSLSPSSVPTAGKSTVTVLLSGPAGTGGVKVPIAYNTTTLATVSIAQSSTSGTATITASRPGSFTLTARLASVTKSVVWTVTPPPVTVLVKNDASAPMGFSFTPATVQSGTPVTWLNQSTGPHSIVWDSRSPTASPVPGANIATFSAGAKSATWTAPRVTVSTTYKYHCGVHGTKMAGTITVNP